MSATSSPVTLDALGLPAPVHLLAFQGTIVRTPTLGDLSISPGVILVDKRTGAIVATAPSTSPAEVDAAVRELAASLPEESRVTLGPSQFLMPGFVDGHAHAPQYAFNGTGLDLPLLDWLERYTFPTEARFKDVAYAKRIYAAAVDRHLRYGTTTCSYFATIHREASEELVRQVRAAGQRAHVGKVSMDRNSPEDYVEPSVREAADEAKAFLVNVLKSQPASEHSLPPLVTPAVIPRFAPSCTPELMAELGELSRAGAALVGGAPSKLPVHTHLSENASECAWVAEMHPDASCYADVYRQCGLLHERTYFAHCCHCNQTERTMVKDGGAGVVHCAASNFLVGGALCNVRRWLEEGVAVGLGTDVAGGWSASMLDAIRQTIITSNIVSRTKDEEHPARRWTPLTWQEALFLATQGGAQVLGLSDVTGDLVVGKQFDALVVDVSPASGGSFDCFAEDDMQSSVEKFLFTGDDRHITSVYVAGKRVAGSAAPAPVVLKRDLGAEDGVVEEAKRQKPSSAW